MDQRVIDEVLAQAEFEFLPEDNQWFGTISGFQGLWSIGPTEDASRHDLESALREWLSLSVDRGLPLPAPPGMNLAASVNR